MRLKDAKVCFVAHGSDALASHRLRVKSVCGALLTMGVNARIAEHSGDDDNLVVYGKHFKTSDYAAAILDRAEGRKVLYDVCDNHFDRPIGEHYKKMIGVANLITCSTNTLRDLIKENTGRDAWVINEAYEVPEIAPKYVWPPKLLWFGHASNVGTIERVYEQTEDYPLEICTFPIPDNSPPRKIAPKFREWRGVKSTIEALSGAQIVLLPRGEGEDWKSANRAVDAIRGGCAVIADPINSYFETGLSGHLVLTRDQDMSMATIIEIFRNESYYKHAIEKAQEFVAQRFSPDTVGDQWVSIMSMLMNGEIGA